jgi:hypothetical protein
MRILNNRALYNEDSRLLSLELIPMKLGADNIFGLDPAVSSWSVPGLDDEVYAQANTQGAKLGKWCLP